MRFEFTVSVEVERESGKFASRDEISELLMAELDVDPGSIDTDNEAVYNVVDWSVEDTSK